MKIYLKFFIATISLLSSLGVYSQTTISPNDPNIQYIGRIDFSNPVQPLFAYPNVTIKAKFTGTSLTLLLKSYAGSNSGNNYFVSIIDSTTYNKFSVSTTQQSYTIAQNLTDGTHTVEIIKVTESYYGECQFLGFQVDAGKSLVTPAPLPKLKLEFYGNSITCGFGIEPNTSTQPAADNSYKAYAAVAARDLKAQFQTMSYSGIGAAKGYPSETMGQIFNRIICITSYNPLPTNNTWDFSKYIPDVVVVALGTNDWTWLTGLSTGTSSAVTQFKTAYNSLLDQIRTAYPNTKIVCTNSPMVQSANLATYIQAVISGRNDANISFFGGYPYRSGGGLYGHPSASEGQTDGLALSAYIKTLLGTSTPKIKEQDGSFSLYPCPASTNLKIKGLKNSKSIKITDLQGKCIKEINNPANNTELDIDISHFKSGIYIVSSTVNGLKAEKKFTKK